ncbi:Os11g0274232 [Oryza sativa Japonica Group]|uniref:Os11g0274232 protein n=1 Tax=Oryza sativa subsp. japonica TaxID=39947 RepID=A0A0P0Y154_ORYSJ|nr:Os11g0274232 [Oryza sativa Japonica Group]
MAETRPMRATDNHHRTLLTSRLLWRNAVEGSDATVFHSIAWLLIVWLALVLGKHRHLYRLHELTPTSSSSSY